MFNGHRDLKVYQLAYRLAMEIFNLSRKFPREEIYSLTDQIRRSSRSVPANLAEGFRKRRYPNVWLNKLTDCDAEGAETQVWLDFAFDCGYLAEDKYNDLIAGYEEVGRMLAGMMAKPENSSRANLPSFDLPSAFCFLLSAFCLLLTAFWTHAP